MKKIVKKKKNVAVKNKIIGNKSVATKQTVVADSLDLLSSLTARLEELEKLLKSNSKETEKNLSTVETSSSQLPEAREDFVSLDDLFNQLFSFFDVVDGVRRSVFKRFIFDICTNKFNGMIEIPVKPKASFGKSFKRRIAAIPKEETGVIFDMNGLEKMNVSDTVVAEVNSDNVNTVYTVNTVKSEDE